MLKYHTDLNNIAKILFDTGTDKASLILYSRTELKTTLFTKRCIAVVSTVATACFLVPISNAIFQYVRGTYTPDVWIYPLKVV